MNIYTRLYFSIIVLFSLPAIGLAVVVSESPENHRVIPGELTYGMNLDGVVLLGFTTRNSTSLSDLISFCTASLISDRHLLSAAHCFDDDHDGVIDSKITDEEVIIAGFELPEGDLLISVKTESIIIPVNWPEMDADLAIMELTQPAPAGLPRYRLNSSKDEVGRRILIVGYGETGTGETGAIAAPFPGSSVKHAGLNRYEAGMEGSLAYDFDSGLEENNSLAILGFPSDLGFGADEAIIGGGDSGSPSFVDGLIAGIGVTVARLPEADVTDFSDSSWGDAGIDIRVSNYQDFIFSATGGQAVFVPEPSSIVLAILGFVGMLFVVACKRKRQ